MIYRIVVCNGNGPGIDIYGPDAEMAVLNPHLEIELNSAGSLEFTLPVENINWNIPNVFQNEIEVWEDDKIIWFGRPLQIIRDWNNQRRVVCEGALSYFNDSIQRTWEQQPATNKTNISFFRHLINSHNNDVMNNKNFIADNITIESIPAYRKTDYDTTLDCLQNMCLAVDGGYFILRKEYIWDVVRQKDVAQRYIDWYEELPDNAMQDVQFGVNLLDISQDLNGADICTVLIVSGKDDVMLNELGNKNPDTNNGVGHDSGSDEIYYAPGVATYGRIVQQKSWNDYSDINELWRKAKTWMIEKNTDIPTIECSAADLYYINDPDMVVDGPLQVGMKVQVVSAPHDFNKQLLMYKISMDLDSGVKKVTLGTPPKKELTDIVAPSSGGSSTSGGKGAAGGSSESGSGSGSGSQTIIAPVQDVKVKFPGETNYTSVVKKKTAKIDLSNMGGGGISDVLVDDESVVDNNVAKIYLQNVYSTKNELNVAVNTLQSNFQDGVDEIYDACVAKGSTPASQSLSDVVQGIMDIPQGGGVVGNIQWFNPEDLLPSLTGPDNTIISASSDYGSGYEAWKALDGDDNNSYWCSASNQGTDWIKVHLSQAVYISTIMFIRKEIDYMNFVIYDDDTDIIIARINSHSYVSDTACAVFEGIYSGKVQNIRIEGTFNGWKALTNIRVWGFDIADVQKYVIATPIMTSDTTPSGILSVSSYQSWGDREPFYAFCGRWGYDWGTWETDSNDVVGAWIQYQFPTSVVIKRLETVNRNESNNRAVKTFIFQGSNDGSTWTDLKNCTITSGAGHHLERFDINNNTAYLYYRLYITEPWLQNDQSVGFAQIYMYKIS